MSDWVNATLGQLGDILSGGTPSRDSPAFWGGDIPWLTPGELTRHSEKYISSTIDSITSEGLAASGARLLPKDSVLVTSRATLGSVALAGRTITTNQGFKALIVRSGDPSFFYFLLQTLRAEFTRRASGTTFLEISGKEFGKVQVQVPPLDEQRRIAEILDAIDETIQATERVIAKLEVARTGVIRRELLHLAGGSMTNVASLVNEVTVGIVVRPTQYYAPTGVPMLRSANVREGGVTLEDLVFMTAADHERMSKSAVHPGDVLTVRTGYPGTSAVVPNTILEANTIDILVTRTGRGVDPEFLALWVNSDFGKGHVLARQGGLAQQHFNVSDMRQLPVPLTHRANQRRVVNLDLALRARVRSEAESLRKFRETRSGLAADLLSGRVRTVAS